MLCFMNTTEKLPMGRISHTTICTTTLPRLRMLTQRVFRDYPTLPYSAFKSKLVPHPQELVAMGLSTILNCDPISSMV